MIDLGKCRIRQLKFFQGKMMASNNLKEFSEMFAPFDENYAMDLAEKVMAATNVPESGSIPVGLDPNELDRIVNQ
jgi:hypothetical protein